MDDEPKTKEERELINLLCGEIGVCSAENVGRCNTCYSIVKALKERAVLMPLAADGKPIMPGDTVWNIFSGECCYVLHIECFKDATLVVAKYGNLSPLVVVANALTHNDPSKKGGANG